MLEELLNEIRSGRPLQPLALAARLNVSLDMVQMMLEDLERRGLLTRVALDCSQPCQSCSVAELCMPHGRGAGRVWKVAD